MDNLKTTSLNLTPLPALGVLLRALLVVLLALLAAEGLARLPFIQRHAPPPSLGNYHYQFEIKWFHLEKYVQEHGGVDVILLGSSLVNSGLDPDAINESWVQASAEEPLRIYNFGVEGLTIEPNSFVAELLIETYHPQVLIFGTEIRDYAANNGVEVAEKFLSDPWVQYQQGQFNLKGWLTEHSAATRIFLAYRNWMTWEFAEQRNLIVTRTGKLTDAGYDVENNTTDVANQLPDPADPEDAEAFETFADFQLAPERIEILKNLMALGREPTGESAPPQIILLEMPVSPSFYIYFERGLEEHEDFVNEISGLAEENDVVFLEAIPESALPDKSRSDRVHLNKRGADTFSKIVGGWLAELYADGKLEVQP
jgi:hypothetical protein